MALKLLANVQNIAVLYIHTALSSFHLLRSTRLLDVSVQFVGTNKKTAVIEAVTNCQLE